MASQTSTFLRTPTTSLAHRPTSLAHRSAYLSHAKPNFIFLKPQKILTPKLLYKTPQKPNTFSIKSSTSSNITNNLSSQPQPPRLSTFLGIMILVSKLFCHALTDFMQGVCKNSNLSQLLTIPSCMLQANDIMSHKTLFFAAIRRGTRATPLTRPHTVVATGVSKCLEVYMAVLAIRCALSWFPNIEWNRQPYLTIRHLSDPFLLLFRDIVPPLFGTLDVTTTLAFMVLGFLVELLNATSRPIW